MIVHSEGKHKHIVGKLFIPFECWNYVKKCSNQPFACFIYLNYLILSQKYNIIPVSGELTNLSIRI